MRENFFKFRPSILSKISTRCLAYRIFFVSLLNTMERMNSCKMKIIWLLYALKILSYERAEVAVLGCQGQDKIFLQIIKQKELSAFAFVRSLLFFPQ